MAKTKHDYFREGVSDFTANNPRRVYTAGSWQERHYNDGWSHACAREAAETEAQCIDLPYADTPIPGPIAKPRWKHDPSLAGTANAVASHVKFLLDQAANDGGKRAHRLRKKATVLVEKWKLVMMADLLGG